MEIEDRTRQISKSHGDDVHVFPMLGPDHLLTRGCWCRPRVVDGETTPPVARVVLHEVLS